MANGRAKKFDRLEGAKITCLSQFKCGVKDSGSAADNASCGYKRGRLTFWEEEEKWTQKNKKLRILKPLD